MDHSRLFALLAVFGTIAASGLSFVACQETEQALVTAELSASFSQERQHFANVEKLGGVHGEHTLEVVKAWANSSHELSKRLADLAAKLPQAQKIRAKLTPQLSELQAQLDSLLSRRLQLVVLVPSWLLDKGQAAVARALEENASLRTQYRNLFGAFPASDSQIVLQASVDELLLDTFSDCFEKLQTFGLAHGDPTCVEEARVRCGHQMDLSCVSERLLLHAAQPCSENKAPLPWLDELEVCRSAVPVFAY